MHELGDLGQVRGVVWVHAERDRGRNWWYAGRAWCGARKREGQWQWRDRDAIGADGRRGRWWDDAVCAYWESEAWQARQTWQACKAREASHGTIT